MIRRILELIGTARLDLSDEKRTQNDMDEIFTRAGFEFKKECRLSARDIPDFMIDGIAIEVKLKGAKKMDVFKQLCRYAEHEKVKALVLVSNITMGLPEEINGKPVYFISMGKAWL